ncbi:unnamed protein product [marine sediment metagenome]|uniref:Uncharacterized protein n=1 Tax=marine sediment metagenome TaxID=412755 RepID=X1GLY1_9ZZZZ
MNETEIKNKLKSLRDLMVQLKNTAELPGATDYNRGYAKGSFDVLKQLHEVFGLSLYFENRMELEKLKR